jgi:hypothetical protein
LNGRKTELTDFWIVNRSAIRLPGRLLPYLGAQTIGKVLTAVDTLEEMRMPA